MNLWRYLGISIFFVVAVCLVGTQIPTFAKDKTDKTPVKTDAKTPTKTDDKKPTEKPTEKKPEEKKPEEKKPAEKQPDVKKGDTLELTAFTKKGKGFFQEQTTTTEQKIKVTNQEVVQKQSQTFIIQWTPQDPDKDGNFVVEQKIVGVKMEINIGGNKISYDSKAANPKNPMTEFFTKLTESSLTFTINKDFKVVKVDGRETFIKGLSEINPQMQALLKAILSDKALISMAEPSWWAFPAGGVFTKDQTWEKKSELDLGPIGKYATDFKFANKGLEGTSKDKYKIDIKTSLTYSAPAATEKVGLPFIIQSAALSSEKGDGYAIFDGAKGRFEKTEINMELKGKLKIEVGNMTTDVDLAQTQKAVSTAHDNNPWAEAAPAKK